MNFLSGLFNKEWKIVSCLLLVSFAIYFFYYNSVFLAPNSILAGITGDALKNYYTYFFHIKNDAYALHFEGMNFPYGEHIVYTDCQPLLANLLRCFPFTHNYAIAILHYLLFLSYIITPLILYKIFRLFNVTTASAFFVAIAITVLSPQFSKINGGHFGLAYGFIVPLSVFLLIKYFRTGSIRLLAVITLYNLLLFFIHPYVGFAACLMSFGAILFYALLKFQLKQLANGIFFGFISGILPMLAFKLFMTMTDKHESRTTEPFGKNTLLENFDSLLAPDFGPYKIILETIFDEKTQHLEGHTYLGGFVVLTLFVFIVALPFFYKRIVIQKELSAIFFGSIFLLFLSFGWHTKILELFSIKSASLNQFRAACRFALTFYYVLPMCIFILLSRLFTEKHKSFLVALSLLYFLSNLWEANFYFTKDKEKFWIYRNLFNEKFLNEQENSIVEEMRQSKAQAIIALPVFHIGSETFARNGADNSMIPAMLYSFHSNIPILGVAMSRTSITETKNALDILNSYHTQKYCDSLLNDNPFVVIKTVDALLPDETRLLTNFKCKWKTDFGEIGLMSKEEVYRRKIEPSAVQIAGNGDCILDSNQVLFVNTSIKKPFTSSIMEDYQTICVLDSNVVPSGDYIVSYHYFADDQICPSSAVDMIVTTGAGENYVWEYYIPGRIVSGWYKSFHVFEYPIYLSGDKRHEFILKGSSKYPYHIRNFLIRPSEKDVLHVVGKDSLYNNFPI